eukprot:1351284-Pleurochrysis_carterae.AAC.2
MTEERGDNNCHRVREKDAGGKRRDPRSDEVRFTPLFAISSEWIRSPRQLLAASIPWFDMHELTQVCRLAGFVPCAVCHFESVAHGDIFRVASEALIAATPSPPFATRCGREKRRSESRSNGSGWGELVGEESGFLRKRFCPLHRTRLGREGRGRGEAGEIGEIGASLCPTLLSGRESGPCSLELFGASAGVFFLLSPPLCFAAPLPFFTPHSSAPLPCSPEKSVICSAPPFAAVEERPFLVTLLLRLSPALPSPVNCYMLGAPSRAARGL